MTQQLRSVCIFALGLGIAFSAAGQNTRYLALGDSLAFGGLPTAPGEMANYHPYPEWVSKSLNKPVANASCPGETSATFLYGLSGLPDVGCYEYRATGAPLFVTYDNLAQTQMAYAVKYLKEHRNTQLVTIDIGLNDLALAQFQCGTDVQACLAILPSTIGRIAENLKSIFGQIRFDAGYRGPIVILNYYAFNYRDPLQLLGVGSLDLLIGTMGPLYGAQVADIFTLFKNASASKNGDVCAAGLLVKKADGTCDTHPTVAAQKMIANAVIAALN